jgi:hypothetical protein
VPAVALSAPRLCAPAVPTPAVVPLLPTPFGVERGSALALDPAPPLPMLAFDSMNVRLLLALLLRAARDEPLVPVVPTAAF